MDLLQGKSGIERFSEAESLTLVVKFRAKSPMPGGSGGWNPTAKLNPYYTGSKGLVTL